jgi:hypothetical protein
VKLHAVCCAGPDTMSASGIPASKRSWSKAGSPRTPVSPPPRWPAPTILHGHHRGPSRTPTRQATAVITAPHGPTSRPWSPACGGPRTSIPTVIRHPSRNVTCSTGWWVVDRRCRSPERLGARTGRGSSQQSDDAGDRVNTSHRAFASCARLARTWPTMPGSRTFFANSRRALTFLAARVLGGAFALAV